MISFKQFLIEENMPQMPAPQQPNRQAPAQQQANPQQRPQGFIANLRAGYDQGKQSTQQTTPDFLDQQNLEKYRKAAEPAIQTASQIASQMGGVFNKIGISPTLAISLIAAGLSGGTISIPLAALTYFADKYANKYAGQAFDKGMEMMGVQSPQAHHEDYSFQSFLLKKYDEGIVDDAGHFIGRMAGKLTGNVQKYANYIGPKLKQAAASIGGWANQNKVPIAKALFLTGIGLAVGAGVGKSYKAITNPDVLNSIGQAVAGTNLVNPQEVTQMVGALSGGVVPAPHDAAQMLTPAKIGSKFAKNLTHTDAAAAAASAAQGVSAGLTEIS